MQKKIIREQIFSLVNTLFSGQKFWTVLYYSLGSKDGLFLLCLSDNLKSEVAIEKANNTNNAVMSLTSCNAEERIAQNIYIHNSNRIYKKLTTTTKLIKKTDRFKKIRLISMQKKNHP